jgi:hypothetical protein
MKPNPNKLLVFSLGILSAVFLFLAVRSMNELQHTKADIRLARDMVFSIQTECDHALKSDVTEAIQYLQRFDVPDDWYGEFQKNLSAIIILERKNAAKRVIAYLRLKTGKDFGETPENWIKGLKNSTNEP